MAKQHVCMYRLRDKVKEFAELRLIGRELEPHMLEAQFGQAAPAEGYTKPVETVSVVWLHRCSSAEEESSLPHAARIAPQALE